MVNYFYEYNKVAEYFRVPIEVVIVFIIIIIVWTIVWKGIALWKSARKNSLPWFIILMVVNTVGILEILYIYVFSEMKFGDSKKLVKRETIKNK